MSRHTDTQMDHKLVLQETYGARGIYEGNHYCAEPIFMTSIAVTGDEVCPTNKVKLQLCTLHLSAKGWQMALRLNRDHGVCSPPVFIDRLPRTYGGTDLSCQGESPGRRGSCFGTQNSDIKDTRRISRHALRQEVVWERSRPLVREPSRIIIELTSAALDTLLALCPR